MIHRPKRWLTVEELKQLIDMQRQRRALGGRVFVRHPGSYPHRSHNGERRITAASSAAPT